MTAGPTPDVRYLRAPHVLWRSTLDAVVLLPDGAEEPFALSGTGPEIWHLFTEPRTAADVVAALADAHGATLDEVAADVEPLIARLVKMGALTVR